MGISSFQACVFHSFQSSGPSCGCRRRHVLGERACMQETAASGQPLRGPCSVIFQLGCTPPTTAVRGDRSMTRAAVVKNMLGWFDRQRKFECDRQQGRCTGRLRGAPARGHVVGEGRARGGLARQPKVRDLHRLAAHQQVLCAHGQDPWSADRSTSYPRLFTLTEAHKNTQTCQLESACKAYSMWTLACMAVHTSRQPSLVQRTQQRAGRLLGSCAPRLA